MNSVRLPSVAPTANSSFKLPGLAAAPPPVSPDLASESVQTAEGSPLNFLSADIEIEGTLHFSRELFFDGKLTGEVISNGVATIGPKARIHGSVQVHAATVFGEVTGSLTMSSHGILKSSAVLNGDLKGRQIAVEEGACITGQVEIQPAEKPVRHG